MRAQPFRARPLTPVEAHPCPAVIPIRASPVRDRAVCRCRSGGAPANAPRPLAGRSPCTPSPPAGPERGGCGAPAGLLAGRPRTGPLPGPEEPAELLDPAVSPGAAALLVDHVLERHRTP